MSQLFPSFYHWEPRNGTQILRHRSKDWNYWHALSHMALAPCTDTPSPTHTSSTFYVPTNKNRLSEATSGPPRGPGSFCLCLLQVSFSCSPGLLSCPGCAVWTSPSLCSLVCALCTPQPITIAGGGPSCLSLDIGDISASEARSAISPTQKVQAEIGGG